MKVDANIEQLKSDIAERIKWAQERKKRDKSKSAFISVYVGIVSAITTISIGIVSFIPNCSDFFGLTSLLTSASLTVVSAWDGMFQHKRLWVNAAITLNDLYELDTDIRHVEKGTTNVPQDQINEFYERYKIIMKNTNERWYKLRES